MQYPGEVLIQNASHSGDTIVEASNRLDFDLLQHVPDVVVMQFGMNDCNYWKTGNGRPRTIQADFGEHFMDIIDRIRFTNPSCSIIINTNHTTVCNKKLLATMPYTYQESVEQYNEIVRAVASLSGVILNDIEAAFKEDTILSQSKGLLMDDLHLSVKGHQEYYQLMRGVLHEEIRKHL
jgi:lysophospholipase L1-like esterase